MKLPDRYFRAGTWAFGFDWNVAYFDGSSRSVPVGQGATCEAERQCSRIPQLEEPPLFTRQEGSLGPAI